MLKKMADKKQTPVYCLDNFSEKAKTSSFYIETLSAHLRDHSFVNAPHKHDFYLVLYVTHGGGTHTIDFKTYDVHPGSFFVMTPGQVHSWDLETGTDGFIIFSEKDFYQNEFSFFQIFGADAHIEPEHDPMLDSIVREMFNEFHKNDIQLLHALLDVLLLKLSRHYKDHSPDEMNSVTFRIRKLEQLIEKNFVKLKKPGDYANMMNLSPAYLNNLCKKHLGKTLSDLINERIVLEAKRLFAYTDLGVAQVSDKLRFSEPSYFIRFFRKNTGTTPERFKESTIRPIQ
jgi:AraC family transcriptional regulator, transcriptional activator of pobA